MRHTVFLATCAAGALGLGSGVHAGDYIPPATEPVVAAPVAEVAPVAAVASGWEGGYVGGSIGYAFGGSDEVGVDIFRGGALTDRFTSITDLEVKGLNAGLHAGYRWQRGNWVFGPELWIEGGDISDEQSDSASQNGEVASLGFESEAKFIAGLQLKAGYAVDPQTLVYGSAGYVHGDFDYTLKASRNGQGGSVTEGYTADGYSLGLGIERKLRDNLSVFAEWQYRNFGKTEVTFSEDANAILTRATPEHHNIKVGVNFSF